MPFRIRQRNAKGNDNGNGNGNIICRPKTFATLQQKSKNLFFVAFYNFFA